MFRRIAKAPLVLTLFAAGASLMASAPAAAEVYGGADRKEPLARFADPLCPGVVGLKRDYAESVVGRIRENAESLGLRMADPATCKANVLVAVLRDGKAYVNRLRETTPYLFEGLSKEQQVRLFDTDAPVRSWVRAVTRTRDGMVVEQPESLDAPPQASAFMAHSRIYVATRRDILSSAVIVDADALGAVSLFQLADYATMRALSGDSGEAVQMPGGSILTLWEAPANAPAELTAGDRSFLATLYNSLPNNPAAVTLSLAQRRIDALHE